MNLQPLGVFYAYENLEQSLKNIYFCNPLNYIDIFFITKLASYDIFFCLGLPGLKVVIFPDCFRVYCFNIKHFNLNFNQIICYGWDLGFDVEN